MREKFPELRTKLGGERLVVGQNQRRLLHLGFDVGHRKCLAGANHPKQSLPFFPPSTSFAMASG